MLVQRPCSDTDLISRLKPIVLVEPLPDGRQFQIDYSVFINKNLFDGMFKESTCFFKITKIGEGEVQQIVTDSPDDFEAEKEAFYVCGGLGCDSSTWSPSHGNDTQPIEPATDAQTTNETHPFVSDCTDTPNWSNFPSALPKDRWTCAQYAENNGCADGEILNV